MPILSHRHHLFSTEDCQAYIHMLRWNERPLQCPRCDSHHVSPWGTYHYRPGCKRYWCHGCKRTFNDLTNTMMHHSQRWWYISGRAITGAGGCAMPRCPTRCTAN